MMRHLYTTRVAEIKIKDTDEGKEEENLDSRSAGRGRNRCQQF